MFIQNAKNNLTSCLLNLQKARSEIFINGDKMENLAASRLKQKLEEAISIARNLNSSLTSLVQLTPSKEAIERKQKVNEAKISKERWSMKWQLN